MMTRFLRSPVWLYGIVVPLAVACWPDEPPLDGTCVVESRSAVDCRVVIDSEPLSAGLVGYSCSGTARPDMEATFSEGVPEGLICADKGRMEDSRDESYCCTEEVTPCAYDPVLECPNDWAGYECWGNNRPESLNPSIRCTNGNLE
jgi:hypothetical protein